MPFEHHKDALIEAAASGAEPQGELRAHLDACASCRAAFEQEQSLFASIDAGLCATANSEVPVSLLPRVRARLDEEGLPRRNWVTAGFALAGAAAMAVVFFAARTVWRTNLEHHPVESVANKRAPALVTRSSQAQIHLAAPAKKDSTSQPRVPLVKNPALPQAPAIRSSMPEVLVPRDQEILLAEYDAQWNLHKRAPLLAQDSDPAILALLQVAPIQIEELGVKLLAEEK